MEAYAWPARAALLLACAGCGRVADGVVAFDAGTLEAEVEAPLDLETACRRFYERFCPAFHACQPDSFEWGWHDEKTCVEGSVSYCLAVASYPGVGDWTAFMRCSELATRDPAFACRGYFRAFIDAFGCHVTGSLPEDSNCESGAQCASGVCGFPTPGCAKCTDLSGGARVPLGASCESRDVRCEEGTGCGASDGGYVCQPLAGEGESCVASVCQPWPLHCKLGTCVRLSFPGEPCDSSVDCAPGGWCDSTRRCVPVPNAAPGEECPRDRDAEPPVFYCTYGYDCVFDPTASRSTCRPTSKLGEPCGAGRTCQRHLTCGDAGLCEEEPSCL